MKISPRKLFSGYCKLFFLCLLSACIQDLSAQTYYGNVEFTSQKALNAWGQGWKSVSGNVYITSLVNDVVTDLTPLQNLTYIEGVLTISENHSLTSLNGLQNLKATEGIEVSFNNSLTKLTGLGGLKTVKGSVIFLGNPLLANLSDLNEALEISGDLTIKDNPRLSQCNVLAICNFLNNHPAFTYLNVSNNLGTCYNETTLTNACNTALSVILADFHVIKEGKSVVLYWPTFMERQLQSFDIEHSQNGVLWHKAGTVKVLGENLNGYTFKDNPFGSGNHLYRLKMNDLDGSSTYSTIQNTGLEGATVYVFPNPVADRLFIPDWEANQYKRVEVFDGQGKTLLNTTRNISQGISLNNWEKGPYIIRIWENNDYFKNLRIVKK